jgi:hypothetical protein
MADNQTFRPPAFSDRRPGVKIAELQVMIYSVVRAHVQRAASEAPPLRGGSAAPHHKWQRELSVELAESEPCTISRAQSMQLTAD